MSYKFDTIVNRQEANALKEMIFKRVRERAEAFSETEQKDVMDLARSSFVSRNNPFSQIASQETKTSEDVRVKASEQNETSLNNGDIGFPQHELKIKKQNTEIVENISVKEVQNTMQEARESLSNRKSFMGALNFLNSQAAVSLIRTRIDKFEVLI